MYVRRLDTLEIHLQASGSLWRDALVLHDPETGTLWSQVTGEGIRGARSGTYLERYPSTVTTFAEFSRQYPQAEVLAKSDGSRGTPYEEYYADAGTMGIFGTQNQDDRLAGKSKVVGLNTDAEAVAVPLPADGRARLQTVTIGEQTLIVYWNPASETAVVYRHPEGIANELSVDEDSGRIRSVQDGISWDAATGARVGDGEIGDGLDKVPFMIAYWFSWRNFYPHTSVAESR